MNRRRRNPGRSASRRPTARTVPLDMLLRRARWRRPTTALVVVLLLVALALLDRSWPLVTIDEPGVAYHGRQALVVRVVDGDTIDVKPVGPGGEVVRVRLWGIDTPEKYRPDPDNPGARLPPDPFAEEASAYTLELCDGRTVRLFIEPQRVFDRYDRLLAYVELPDGTLLNERLLMAGLARADDRWAHTHVERFAMLELDARRNRRGMWADGQQ